MAHGIDALSANFDAVAQTPYTLLGFRGSAPSARTFRAANRNDCVIVFAIHAAGSHGILEGIDRQQSFDKYLEQFHEAAILLYRDDQALVFIAEMLFHELRGLPIAQFAYRGSGAPLGL